MSSLFRPCVWIAVAFVLQTLTVFSQPQPQQNDITPANALEAYLHNGDTTFYWRVVDSVVHDQLTTYNLLLTSQKWQDIEWVHQLQVFVPTKNLYSGALLFVTGGSNKDGMPRWKKPNDPMNFYFSSMASKNKAVVAVIHQVPNQPLFGTLTEDALISKTLHDFKEDGDYSKPLLFPMVKSAVRAMDAVQEFSRQNHNHPISKFVVSGASKRGWTTWLTGAADERVAAIAPMVIDILNMPVSLAYQVEAFGGYSLQIEDYVRLGILNDIQNETGDALVAMIDPYSYRERLDMPKMLMMGTNDEYWVVDNVKNYLPQLEGVTLLHYVPNVGHNLGGGASAFRALSAFFGNTLRASDYPQLNWETGIRGKNVEVNIHYEIKPLSGKVWFAHSTDRDFRKTEWTSRELPLADGKTTIATENLPENGYRAFYVELRYPDAAGGTYTVCTRVFMVNNQGLL